MLEALKSFQGCNVCEIPRSSSSTLVLKQLIPGREDVSGSLRHRQPEAACGGRATV